MTEFDPAALLRQLRAKTPTKVPELPPRPVFEEVPVKSLHLEDRISALESQLKVSLNNEQKYQKERDSALQQLKEAQLKNNEIELRFTEKIKFLEAMLDREKSRKKEEIEENPGKKSEIRPKSPIDLKKPAFTSAVSNNSARYPANKQKGYLDLGPLIELYKIMPDFPRPVIKLEFSMSTPSGKIF